MQLNDNLSITRGNHTIRTGGDLRFTKNFAASSNNARGNISFNGQFTARVPGQSGNAIADLLLAERLGLSGKVKFAFVLRFLHGEARAATKVVTFRCPG